MVISAFPTARESFVNSFPSLEKIWFSWAWLYPLSSTSCTTTAYWCFVPRFTIFTENFVICCYQVTNFFCTKYGCARAFSARRPCYLGYLADFAISVLREVKKILCLPDTTFYRRFLLKRFTRDACGCIM